MQTIWKHYLQAHWTQGTALFELKRVVGSRIPVKAFRDHQIAALYQAATSSLYYKIPDEGISQKPADCFVMSQVLAFVVIGFGERLQAFHVIPILVWVKNTAGTTSVTQDDVESWPETQVVVIPKK